ncbi:hypothetical protein E3J62_08085 [candidate division TA06 bacterium]|uniref:HNH endonuclease n=1 Tax=candidate division TA06 bacterium TaxID=2250710 RepID=A0A523URM0_UNCT6|nr:MAG: hypothetical protein E3J62_08085 [candidate division TA06 bacterium]
MSRKRKLIGTCHLCGNRRQLSFEHVPPRAAFNDKRVIRVQFEKTIGLGPDEIVKGSIQQRGMGDYTLCVKCNNDTGAWYGGRFVDWCYQGMEILVKSGGKPSLIYLNRLYPLAILKQIVTMFLSVDRPVFREANPDLVRFVLYRYMKYLPPKYRFFTYYNTTGRFRCCGTTVLGDMSGNVSLISEITYPPFGYVMTIGSDPPDKRLFEITHFSRFGYLEPKVMTMSLPVLPTHLVYPGDYRTKEEIIQQRIQAESEQD